MKNLAKTVLTNPVHFLAFGFGAGLSPKAPGTMGTLVALPIIWFMQYLSFEVYIIISIIVTLGGTVLAHYSSKWLGVHDHSGIVIDEIAGMMWVMAWFPVNILTLLLGFVLFRIFDVLKPFPIRWLDHHVDGGVGIMVDDLLAAAYAALLLLLLLQII
jgi:phosphatidylglycerophosphatase A